MYRKKSIVCQVGYLQELNKDARSTKHKIQKSAVFIYFAEEASKQAWMHSLR